MYVLGIKLFITAYVANKGTVSYKVKTIAAMLSINTITRER